MMSRLTSIGVMHDIVHDSVRASLYSRLSTPSESLIQFHAADPFSISSRNGSTMVSSFFKKLGNVLALNKGTKITGQNVLITGGTSGMGLIMAKECAKRGANAVIIWDIARIDETVETLKGLGVKAGGYKVNVADVENVNAQAEQTLKDFGKVDILIQCAGVVSGKRLLDLTDEQIGRRLDINLRGVFSVIRAFLGQMKARNHGHIAVISSAGTVGPAKMTDYCATKWGVRGMLESLRNELRKEGSDVKTLTIYPFYVNTGMFEGAKTKVPLLFPILDQYKVSMQILDAIESGQPELFIPKLVKYATSMMRVLPTHWYDIISTWLGINASMDDFVGRQGQNK